MSLNMRTMSSGMLDTYLRTPAVPWKNWFQALEGVNETVLELITQVWCLPCVMVVVYGGLPLGLLVNFFFFFVFLSRCFCNEHRDIDIIYVCVFMFKYNNLYMYISLCMYACLS